MKIKIWGCRGSLPTPMNQEQYRTKLNSVINLINPEDLTSDVTKHNFIDNLPTYLNSTIGGNTTCIEVRDKYNNVLIIDTGSGARELGKSLLKDFPPGSPHQFNILYTHTHWDHTCGLMFFAPVYITGYHIKFWSMYFNLKERLEFQQNPQFFPIGLDLMAAKKEYKPFPIGETVLINNLKITSMEMNHPGGCLGYRIEEEGSVFTFCTDTEFDFDNKHESKKYCDFIKDSNLVIFDTQYMIKQIHDKKNWGHSTGLTATDLCLNSNVNKLIMFHHDPGNDDHVIYENYEKLVKYKNIKNEEHKLKIEAGYEGQTFDLS